MRYILGLLLVFWGCVNEKLYAQMTDKVNVRKFTQKDGLGSYNIRKILQDKWGFIWIATQDGISRFDGKNLISFSKNTPFPRNMSGSDIKDFVEDPGKNLIWTLSHEGGIDIINSITSQVDRSIPIPNMGREGYNISLLRNGSELWVGTSLGVQIFDQHQNKFGNILPLPENQRRSINFATRSMQKDEQGNIWVCYGGYGIVIYNGTDKTILQTITLSDLAGQDEVKEIRIPRAIFLKDGDVLLATTIGLRRIQYDESYHVKVHINPCEALSILNHENIDWITIDSQKSLLISGFNGLYRFNYTLDKYQVIQESSRSYESNWLSSVLSILIDHSGNTWLGCQEGLGYIDKDKTPFDSYSHEPASSIKLDHVFAVSPILGGNILVGLRSGLVEIRRKDRKYFHFDKGHLYQHIFTDPEGNIHVSRPDGLFIYRSGGIVPVHKVYPEFEPYTSYSINSHLFIDDTLTILGTENNKGILLWNRKKRKVRSIDISGVPSLASSIVNNIFRDKAGRIWVLSDYAITILSPDLGSARKIELKNSRTSAPYRLFFDMCEARGSYWMASYSSGVLQLDEHFHVKRVYDTQSGLSNDGVYQLYSLSEQMILVTSNNGLSRIDLPTGKVSRYYLNDGLHSNAFEEVSGVMMEGQIYAGGVNGFTIVDPKAFSLNKTPPKLYFSGIEMKTDLNKTDTNNILIREIEVPNNVIQTTIRFAGLNYANPDRLEYSYRIVEESNNWIENGNQAFLTLISHPPGTYTMEVKAVNEDGASSKPIKLLIYFRPKWYQTWSFKAFIVVIAMGIVYQYYRIRIRQIQREHSIRQRLASDLHDDLGSSMNSIKIYTNLAIMEYGDNRYLTNIKQAAQDSITGIRDIIWILDDQKDDIEQLGERISQFAYPLCEANRISFVLSVGDKSKDMVFRKEEKRNIYMITKEAINNSIKYARSNHISVSMNLEGNKLSIAINDNGTGFDLEKPRKGNGLNNMERRAKEINYKISIDSSSPGGTTIMLKQY